MEGERGPAQLKVQASACPFGRRSERSERKEQTIGVELQIARLAQESRGRHGARGSQQAAPGLTAWSPPRPVRPARAPGRAWLL
eukprot:9330763-Alexandrium_andersonii.AAC.2